MKNKTTLGQTIRNRRKELSLTIKELSTKIGLSEQAISQYELDKRVPDESTLVRIAVALKTSALLLLADSGKNEDEVRAFYDTAIAFSKNIKKSDGPENINENPQSYYLEQYIHTFGYDIIGDLEEGDLFLKSKAGTYGIEMKDLEELQTSSRSFIEFKLHEIINKSRKIGK